MGYLTRTDVRVADYEAQRLRTAPFEETPEFERALTLEPFNFVAPQVTAYGYGRYRDNLAARRIARRDAYEQIVDGLHRETGTRLANPMDERFVDLTPSYIADRYTIPGDPVAQFQVEVARLVQGRPELERWIAMSAPEAVEERADRIRAEATRAYHDYLGDGDVIDQLVRGLLVAPGMIVGAMSTGSPEQVGQVGAGIAGRGLNLLERFGAGALANMAAQGAVEPAIIEDARRMGEERTGAMYALDFILAGLIGGGLEAVGGAGGRPPPSVWADFELSGRTAGEARIVRARSALREALTLPPLERDVTPLDEPGSGVAVQEALAGRAESLVVAAGQRDRATLAAMPDAEAMSPEALVDDILANDAYVRGDPDAPNPVRTEPVRPARAGEIEAAARQADEAPAPPVGTRESVTMNGRVRPRTFERFAPAELSFDAAAFQFKRSTGRNGSTGRLDGVETWDGQSAGKIIVFEGANGRLYVADGHQRVALAQQLAAQGQTIALDGYRYRAVDGWTEREVRHLAQKNLRESVGDPLDAASLMREAPDLIDGSIPQRGPDFRMARSLARLSDEAFAAVRAGVIEPKLGAIIGEVAADRPEIHSALVAMFQRDPPANLREAHFIVREATQAAVARMEAAQLSMFDDPLVLSGMRERAEILRHAGALLREDKRVFAVAERHADALEAAGNVLAADENARRADVAAALLREIDSLATRPGPVADALREIAARAAENKTSAKVAAREFVERVAALLDERGLIGLKTEPPLREPPPAQLAPLDQRLERDARAARLREGHDRDDEALLQTMAEVALARAMRGEVGEVIPEDAIGAQREADIARVEEAADALGVEADFSEIQVAAAILARADQGLADEARLRLAPDSQEPLAEGAQRFDSFAEAAEQDAEIVPPWLPEDFDDALKLREAIDKATLPELEAVARAVGLDGEARTRAEYAALFESERGFFAKATSLDAARASGYRGQDTGEAAEWVRAREKGLPMDEVSRMARAREMGFDIEAFRGMAREHRDEVAAETPGRAQYFSETPDAANTYARGSNANVVPARLRMGRNLTVDAEGADYLHIKTSAIPDQAVRREAEDIASVAETNRIVRIARRAGYDSVTFLRVRDDLRGKGPPVVVHAVFEGRNIRSIHAAFDPDYRDSANLLAAHGAVAPRAPLATTAQLETALRSAFPRWGDKLIERYRLSLVQSVSDLPLGRDVSRGSLRDTILGYAQGGQAWIVADNVSPEMLRGLTLHEIGVHVGMREMLGEAGMARVLGEIERLRFDDADIAGGYESAIRARTPESQMAEEALAYAIQYADPETMSTGLRGLIARIANSVRAWLWRTFPGLRIAGTLTFEDMRWLALGGLRHAARTEARYLDARGRWASWDDLDKMLGENRRGGTPGLRRSVPPDFPEPGTPEWAAAVAAAREAQKSGQRLTDIQRALIKFEEGNDIPEGMFARGDTEARGSEPFHDDRLTAQQNKAVEMARNNFKNAEIADELDTSVDVVRTYLRGARELGIEIESGRAGRPAGTGVGGWTTAELYEMRERGLTPAQISERTGVPYKTLSARLSQERRRRGLTPAGHVDRAAVAARWDAANRAGESFAQIAAREGVTENVVKGAVLRRRKPSTDMGADAARLEAIKRDFEDCS